MTNINSISLTPETAINSDLIAKVVGDAPRALSPYIQAELLILQGQYLLHYWDCKSSTERYKFLSAASVRQAFANEPIDSGWLPPSVVRWGSGEKGEWITQYFPPKRYTFPFVNNLSEKPDKQVIELSVPLPGLLFFGYGTNYYLWATKQRGLLFNPSAIAYHPPLPNIDNNGKICFGTNAVPTTSAIGIKLAWQLFCTSPFNHDHNVGKSKRYPDDIRPYLIKLHQQQNKKYLISDLVPVSLWSKKRLTLDELVTQYLKFT